MATEWKVDTVLDVAGLQALNSFLSSRSFLGGYQITALDVAVYNKLEREPKGANNVARWFRTIAALNDHERSIIGGEKKGEVLSDAAAERKARKQQEKLEKLQNKDAKKEKKEKLKQEQEGKATKAMTIATQRDQEEQEYVNTTPAGDLKDFNEPMLPKYNPKAVEASWNSWWEKHYYAPGPKTDSEGKPLETFTMVIPPPNVTGSLHLGHALTLSIEDAVARWHRMNGKRVLWVPGCDHAGIATQVVVEKQLMKLENKTRWDFSREDFVAKVWEWKEKYGGRIYEQIRRMGASVDWSRAAFTMDDVRSKAVQQAFIQMFNNGVIYRGTRLNNWCSTLRTAISDIEVEYIELEGRKNLKVPGHGDKTYPFGLLTRFAYKVENSDEELVVATTRPETMLGDTAVAVHPDDPRYKHLHGKLLVHPFNNRRIPIIADAVLVDMNFGTGAVKITPAHDPNDFQCGKRHNLEQINIFTNDGKINANGAPFEGLMRFDCRVKLVEELKAKGLFRGEEDNKMSVPICSRSGDIIEPRLIPQWWVNCDQMAADAVKAVREGDLKIIPEQHKATWYHWLENIQDWCISRQLWWGHRIPAYRITVKGKPSGSDDDMSFWVVGHDEKEALAEAQKKHPGVPASDITLEQDPDVLDTWFSSGLFPFSTLGWPDKTVDMSDFFPTTLLETGHDILFFWVARMVMMSQHLTGKLPFTEVYLHAMVRDKYGRKMSKSLGNVVDPLEVVDGCSLAQLNEKLYQGNLPQSEIEKALEGQKLDFPQGIPVCGTDALRFGLLAYTVQGQDVNLDICRVVGYRNFCNKLWNATILMRMSFDDVNAQHGWDTQDKTFIASLLDGATAIDRWILSRLAHTVSVVYKSFEDYLFGDAAHTAYRFFMDELCPVYLEAIKPRMRGDDQGAKAVIRKILYTCFDISFRLLHPMMPFVTEELWHRLPGHQSRKDSLMIQKYPKPSTLPDNWRNVDIEEQIALVLDIVHTVRSQKTSYNITTQRPELFVVAKLEEIAAKTSVAIDDIRTLAQVGGVTVVPTPESIPKGCSVAVINKNLESHLLLTGLVDFAKEAEKMHQQRAKKVSALEKLQKTMELPGYLSKAPPEKIDGDKAKLAEYQSEIDVIDKVIADLAQMS